MKKKSILALLLSFVLIFSCMGMFGCEGKPAPEVKPTPEESKDFAVFMFKNGETVQNVKIDVSKFTATSTLYDVIKSSDYAETLKADVATGDRPFLNEIYGIKPNPENEFVCLFSTLEKYKYDDSIKAVGGINFYSCIKGIGEVLLVKDATYLFSLESYADPTQPVDVESAWSSFRGDQYNSGITKALTPGATASETPSEDDAKLKWSTKVATSWSDSPSVQIIVGDSLVVAAGKTIRKYDLSTGVEQSRADMVAAMSFGIVPPTYGAGMIFVPLSGGTIQAFNATTLQSLWVYHDALKGQGLSQITYSNGYIYTGFWNSEAKDANFVCIKVIDEDINVTNEEKLATWSFTNAGGFYWVGAVVIGDAVIVGADNGSTDKQSASHLYSFNRLTGKIISDIPIVGDQRSVIVYEKLNNRIYFTTKCGNLYYATVNASSGEISNVVTKNYELESTSSPVIYNGRLYIGIGSLNGAKNQILVVDANTLDIIYAVDVKGYPQCSMLLSTAYLGTDQTVYIYSTYNSKPGGITLFKDRPGKTTPTEVYDIFTPTDKQANYCICSIIAGSDGTLYYKNDSGYVFAVGKK